MKVEESVVCAGMHAPNNEDTKADRWAEAVNVQHGIINTLVIDGLQ